MIAPPERPLFPYQALLGFRISAWSEGAITLTLPAAAPLLDGDGAIDRGVIASLLDAATGLACCHGSTPEAPKRIVTLALTTHYLRPARTAVLTVEGKVIEETGKLVLGTGCVLTAEGTIAATGSARMRRIGGAPSDR